jgi:ADP-heptose:LPS heptosyltransferase
MADCADFADTAALVAGLDLVIGVDTAVIHLAGAIGKPVWMLNRFDSCWRWLREGETSPWYPAMHIYRQPSPGAWAEVVEAVSSDLSLTTATRGCG